MSADYAAFLASKAKAAPRRGLRSIPPLRGHLKAFQVPCVVHALEIGSAGTYLATGLGKTAVELEYQRIVGEAINKPGLILTPLAVTRQIEREAHRWDYEARVIRCQADAGPGINICNYDRLDKLDPAAFGPISFDESSLVKAQTGKVARAIVGAFAGHQYRQAPSATPAPNDHAELGMQAELLGVMTMPEMLIRWFVNDSANTGTWRLKGHAETDFWNWMASWSRMAEHPRDLGFDEPGYDLPPLRIVRHRVDEAIEAPLGSLFASSASLSATTLHDVKRQTIAARAALAADVISREPTEPWVVWCDTNYEADVLARVISDAVEVRGSMSIEEKEDALEAFSSGQAPKIITKPEIAGRGLNWQHCARQLFVGRSFSYENWHQAVRRCWRFGQARPVDAHIIVADGEDAIGRVLDRKGEDHARMHAAMAAAMRRDMARESAVRVAYNPTVNGRTPSWL